MGQEETVASRIQKAGAQAIIGVIVLQLWEALVLAVVQGLTEFLPVSSSGHLVLASWLLGVRGPTIAYDILVHFGTLLAIFAAFWPEIQDVWASLMTLLTRPKTFRAQWQEEPAHRILMAIVVGTIPAVVVAFLFYGTITRLFGEPYFTGAMLIVTGTILFVCERLRSGQRALTDMTPKDGLWIGIGQALAILPGLSRSGTTISAGLVRGLDRESSARFSFLLTIPAILGGMVLAVRDLWAGNVLTPTWILVAGVVVSALTGFAAIKLLMLVVRRGRLTWFSYYTWTMGTLLLLIWWLRS